MPRGRLVIARTWPSAVARLAAVAVSAAAATCAVVETVRIQRAPRLPESARGLDMVVPPGRAGASDHDLDDPGALEPLSLVAIGDSVVSGVGCSAPERSVPAVLATLVAQRLNHPVWVRCLGRTGARAEEVRAEQGPRLAELDHVDLVVASVGANDAAHLTPPGRFTAALRALCAEARAATDAPVLLTGVPEFRSARAVGWPLRLLVWLVGWPVHERQRRIATELDGVGFIDVLAEVGPEFRRDPQLMAEDGYHPSDRGAARLAEAIAPSLVSLMGEAVGLAEPRTA
jgi:lysophospholipase L1-like esterase